MTAGEVALGGLDEVRDQVMAALELDVDLGEGVAEGVPQRHEAVVHADDDDGQDEQADEQDAEEDEEGSHSVRH